MRNSIIHIVFRFGISSLFLGLAIATAFATETGPGSKNSFAQDIQVSIGGSPVSSGYTEDFGSINLLSASSAITITIENIGSPEDLTVNTISLGGAHTADFNLTTSGLPVTLGPAATATFTISFSPLLSGVRTATIQIVSDDPDTNPFVINLEGTGVKLDQTITFNPLSSVTFGDGSFALSATASSGLPISYSSSDPSVATISGNTVTIVGAGTTTITASQVGNDTYNAAPVVNQNLLVNKATPVITWNAPSAITYGTALSATQLNAAASVAGTFTYTPASGVVLNAGVQVLSVDFVPTDAANYNSVAGTTVNLTVNKATPTVTWATPAAITYGTALSATQLNATASVAGTLTYTPAAGAVLNAGAQVLSVDFVPTDAANYNAVAGTTVNLTVNKATPTVTWATPAAITYGTALSATQLNATASVAGTFTYTPAAGAVLNAGAQVLSVDFVPTDAANYNAVAGTTVNLTVNKATPTVTWATPAAITYGTALSATQLNATASVAGTFTYTPAAGAVLNAGAQVLSVDFVPTDAANYNAVAGTTVNLTVNKATPTVTWATPAAITYGTALSATQLNATSSVAGTFTYTPAAGAVLNAGVQVLSVDFVPTNAANYNAVSGTTVNLTVNKATPTVTWATPAAITYGTALSATQLNATSSVAGTFTYTPAAGAVLNAGVQVLSVDFVPTDAANYNSVAGTTVNLTVNKATPTVTWATPAAITYGTPLSATQLNATASVPGTFTYTPAAGAVLNAGAQVLSVDFVPTDVANYNAVAGTTVNLTVNKATPTVTWATPASITYGTALSATQLNATASVAGTFTYTPASGTVLNAGNQTLSVNFTPTDAANYNIVNNTTVVLEVTKATLTATANNQSRTYGAANPAFTISYTGFVNGDNAGVLNTAPTAGSTATNASPVGAYPITVTGGVDDNYNFTYVNGTLTINKATLTATADNRSKAYGAAIPALTITYTGFVNSENAAVLDTPPTATTTATTTSNVGSYPITVSGGVDDNYAFNYVSGTLTINKAILSAIAENKTRTYGAANPVFTIAYTGFVNGETPAVLNTAPVASSTVTATTPVGSYSISLTGGSDDNYDIVNTAGTITITKATLTVTAQNASRVYGAANPVFTFNYSGFVNGETAAVLTSVPTASTTATQTSNVGTYPITVSGGTATNYDFSYNAGTLTINKATVTATAANASRVYQTANPVFVINYTGFANGEDFTVLNTLPVASTTATLSSSVGTYPITVSGGDDNNYTFNYVSGTLTITKATPTVTWNTPAPIVYGTPLSATQLNATASVSGTFAYTPSAGTILNTGSNQVLSVNFTPTDITNYNVVNGTTVVLEVTKATLTATANNQSRTYGATNPAFTISYSGFVNGDTPAVLDTAPSASSAATTASPVGTYPITVTGGTDNNYNFTYVNGTLTVNKATLTATADNQSRLYGAANPTFTISYSGFVNGDNASVINSAPLATTAATVTSNVGTYPITVSGGTDDNYTFAYVSGTLTINKATVTATAANATKVYQTANPAFTINYTGFVNGENSSVLNTPPVASTTAILSSPVGTYPITVAGGSDDNYTFAYVSGTLTITRATPVVTWNNPSPITYGTALSATQLNATASVAGTFTYVPALGTVLNAGANQVLTVNFSPSDAANYNPVNGTTVQITVNKANPEITWSNPSAITYGTALSATQLNASANVAGTFTYTPAAGTILNAGANQVLSVNFVPTDNANYNAIGATALITVNKATPIVTWSNPAAITYGTPLSATQLNATASVAGSFIYAPGMGTVLNAGANQALSVNFTPTDALNYNSVNGTTVFITVNKATPTVTWNNPAAITYGTLLSATQLNATASVAGTFVYTPPSGTLLNAGADQVLSVNFSPTDLNNYNPVNGTTVLITVNKATPVITWNNPVAITYGTPLSATQLNATANVSGVFVYTPSAGTVLNAGANQILSVNFTPTDAANYNAVTNFQRTITVNKADPVITWANPASIVYGTPLGATQLNATANVPGTFLYTPASGTILNVGVNQTLSLNFTPTDGLNYNSVIGRTALITVTKATPVVTWATPLPIKINEPLSSTQLNATANVAGTFTYTPAIGASFATAGTYTLTTSFTPTDALNYNSVPSTQVQITVNDKDNPNVTWSNPAAITYGTLLSATQLNATASVPGTFTYTPAIGTLLNAGANQTLSVTFVPTNTIDYNTVVRTVQITVNKAVLTATATDRTRVYGAANPSFPITYTGFVNSETISVIDTPPIATCSAIAGDNAGSTFPIIPSGGIDNNYNFNYVNGTLTITKATLTARADDKSRSYGLPNPVFTISYTGFVNGDTESEITAPTAASSATALSNVGSYPITLSGGVSINYNFVLQNGTLTVNPAPLIARPADVSKTYGQATPALTITYSGFLNGDNVSAITQPTVSTTATTTSSVGTYPITLAGGSATNYSIILQSGVLTINKAQLTVTANNQSRVYGAANPSLTFVYAGFVNGENASVIDTPPVTSTSATVLSGVGNYPINVSGGTDNNYNLNYVAGTLTITKKVLTATAANASRTYGAANPTFTITYTGFVNSEDATVIDVLPVASTTATVNSATGTYPITLSGGTDNNYSFSFVSGTLTITKATLIATAENASREFGVANPTFTISYTGFRNGETSAVLDNPPTASTTAIASSPVGTYAITLSGGTDNNYTFTYVSGTLTIVKATPVVTWNNPAAITYGTALSATQLNASVSVAGTFTYTPAIGTILNAGANQVLSVDFTPSNTTNYNSVTGVTVLITVNKATPVITWNNPAAITYGTALSATQLNATANVAGSFVYNPSAGTVLNAGANQVLSVNFTPTDANNYNAVNGTTVQITVNKANPVITWNTPAPITYGTALSATQLNASANVSGTFVYTPAAGTVLNAGANQTLSANFTPTNTNNYNTINGTTVNITVNKATPVITWANPSAITYGTVLSATQLNATANTAGTFTYTPASGTVLNAGANQVLSVNFTPSNTNNFNSVNGTTVLITVNKANPVISWSNPSAINYGTALGATQLNATASVSGTFTYSPPSGTLLNAGANQKLAVRFVPTNTNNYNTIEETAVTITVNKINLTARANNISRVYGLDNPPLTITYTGFVNGELESVLDNKPIASTTATRTSSVSAYPITVSGGADNNYNFVYAAGTLTITKATLTATADNKTKLFGTPNPELTISYTGFANSDDTNDIDEKPTVSTAATVSSPQGGYPITVSGGSDNNYNFTYEQGTLTVTPNFPPTLTSFSIQTPEDVLYTFAYETFADNFSSFSGSPIQYVKVISLPAQGTLFWKGNPVAAGAEIAVESGAINNFVYQPKPEFSGSDSFIWNAFEGVFSAAQNANVSISVVSVNDPPVLSNIELTPVLYSLGDPAIPVSTSILISDIDNANMFSATISIVENFTNGDLLSYRPETGSPITVTYNSAIGMLELTGKDTRANYEAALAKITFSSPVTGAATISDKRIAFVVRDSLDASNVVSRIVSITEVFPEVSIVNAFTPNGDGVNDYWDFVGLDFYSDIEIRVFDRNNSLVFHCQSVDCKWDGRKNGVELSAGPYFYTIYLNGGKRKYQGTVTILK
ncbi:MAG: MBG domain-containing protein [Cyclobacteriaceae bacterium]|nr:MAG: MBG domain-containing protein [Cyclobacteriaceae bacterium]